MRRVAGSLLLLAIVSPFHAGHAQDKMISPLKKAFQEAREQHNIDLVLPVLQKAKLYIVGARDGAGKDVAERYFLTPSPNRERFCVTVSESLDNLKSISWPKFEVTGAQLLKELPPAVEIVVIYQDGGDYLPREHLEWYRQVLKQP